MVRSVTPDGTSIQKVSSMVEWYLMDRSVEVVFRRNEYGRGKLAPEFDHVFIMDGRLITERCLAMNMMCEFHRRNYKYTLPQILACMTEQVWKYYLSEQAYPEWLAAESLQTVLKRPRGRPRRVPKAVAEKMGITKEDSDELVGSSAGDQPAMETTHG